MEMVSKKDIFKEISTVIDPGLGFNLVEMPDSVLNALFSDYEIQYDKQ